MNGSVPVLAGLDCSDEHIWRDAVRLRVTGIIQSDNEAWLAAMVAELSGPTIYEQMLEEGWPAPAGNVGAHRDDSHMQTILDTRLLSGTP